MCCNLSLNVSKLDALQKISLLLQALSNVLGYFQTQHIGKWISFCHQVQGSCCLPSQKDPPTITAASQCYKMTVNTQGKCLNQPLTAIKIRGQTIMFSGQCCHASMVSCINKMQPASVRASYDCQRLVKTKFQLRQFICNNPMHKLQSFCNGAAKKTLRFDSNVATETPAMLETL